MFPYPYPYPDPLLALAGNSLRDATRVALSSPEMVLDFLLTNRRRIPAAVRAFQRILGSLARADERRLRKLMESARRRRAAL